MADLCQDCSSFSFGFFVGILLHSFTHLHNPSRACIREASPQHDGAFIQLRCGDLAFLLRPQYALNKLSCQHVSIKSSPSAKVFKPFFQWSHLKEEKKAWHYRKWWETMNRSHGDNGAHSLSSKTFIVFHSVVLTKSNGSSSEKNEQKEAWVIIDIAGAPFHGEWWLISV